MAHVALDADGVDPPVDPRRRLRDRLAPAPVPNSPERVGRYLDDHGIWGTFLFRAGFFDVYGSWWFALITTLLFVSLAACLFPRTRAMVRALRQRPVQARELDAFRHHAELRVDHGPDLVAADAASYLRRKRFRVSRQDHGVAAEKGVLREVGSLLFHWAFFLLLVGVIVGKGTGFTGRAVVTEGETWIDARANYDGEIRTGRYFGERTRDLGSSCWTSTTATDGTDCRSTSSLASGSVTGADRRLGWRRSV